MMGIFLSLSPSHLVLNFCSQTRTHSVGPCLGRLGLWANLWDLLVEFLLSWSTPTRPVLRSRVCGSSTLDLHNNSFLCRTGVFTFVPVSPFRLLFSRLAVFLNAFLFSVLFIDVFFYFPSPVSKARKVGRYSDRTKNVHLSYRYCHA